MQCTQNSVQLITVLAIMIIISIIIILPFLKILSPPPPYAHVQIYTYV